MRLLVISSYYAPETAGNAPYVTGMCEGLAARGHDVDVAAGFPHYPWWAKQERGIARTERIGGVTVRRRTHYVPRRPTLLRRGLYEATLTAAGLAGLPKRRPDAIVAVVPSQADAVVVKTAAALYRRRFGIVYQDLMGAAAQQVGAGGQTRGAGSIARLERALARQATAVAVVAEGYKPYLVEGGVDPERIMTIPNWAEYVSPTETRVDTRGRLGWANDEIVCVYAGSLGYKQGLEAVVDSAAFLADLPVRIVLAGDGNERAVLIERIRSRGLAVDVLPPSVPGAYEALLQATDVLLLNQRTAVNEMSIASKLGSYLRAGRPIVGALAAESQTAKELSRAGAGLLADPDDPGSLAAAVRAAALDPQLRATLGEQGAAYAKTHLERDRAIDRYELFLDALRPGAAASIHPVVPSTL